MAKEMGGHRVARMLKQQEIGTIFTLCGGHVDPIYNGCLTHGVDLVDVRHEQAAAHAADAWARLTRGCGVAVVTAGPGVTGTVTAVANAQQARSPLIVIGGAAPRSLQGRGALQEMEQVALFEPITKWSAAVPSAAEIPTYMDRAFRTALGGRPGPVFLEMAFDVLLDFTDAAPLPAPAAPTRPTADAEGLERAATLLAGAARPVVVAGTSAYWEGAGPALDRLVRRYQIPTYLNGMARGLLPATHPAFFRHGRSRCLREADVVLVIGTPLDFRLKYGDFGEAALIRVEPEAAGMERNRSPEVALVGDAAHALDSLAARLEALDAAPATEWFQATRQAERAAAAAQEEWEQKEDTPVNHFRFAAEINRIVDAETIVIGDGGDVVAMAAKVIDLHGPGQWLDPGPLGCLGIGEPFALAAKKLHPESRVLVISGDGSFGFNGMELDSAIRQNLPFVTVIGNDAQWGQIRNPQLQFFGEQYAAATKLAFTRYDLLAEALGGRGFLVEGADEIAPALNQAFATGRTAVVNVALDPDGIRHLTGRTYV